MVLENRKLWVEVCTWVLKSMYQLSHSHVTPTVYNTFPVSACFCWSTLNCWRVPNNIPSILLFLQQKEGIQLSRVRAHTQLNLHLTNHSTQLLHNHQSYTYLSLSCSPCLALLVFLHTVWLGPTAPHCCPGRWSSSYHWGKRGLCKRGELTIDVYKVYRRDRIMGCNNNSTHHLSPDCKQITTVLKQLVLNR